MNCWDPAEDSDTGGPSSITVRMEYLRAFQYWYCELCVENQWGRKHCFVNFCSLAVLESSVDGMWMAVGWGCKSYLGSAEIVSFSSRSFSHLNQICFKCEIPLLFFLRPQMFFKIGALKIFSNFTGKHLCWSLFLIKLQPRRSETLLKRDSNTVVFLSN